MMNVQAKALPYLLYLLVLVLWLARLWLDADLHNLLSPTGDWANTLLKFFVFVLPVVCFANRDRLQARGWWVGLAVGAVYFLLRLTADVVIGDSKQQWPPWTSEFSRLADVIAEEILFRLVLLSLLEKHLSFAAANGVQSLMFLGIHLPGWILQGLALATMLEFSVGVLVVGLMCGYLNKNTNTFWAGVAFHWCWNFTAVAVVL
jgi:membrane protease YdiL (CAAX protease family)